MSYIVLTDSDEIIVAHQLKHSLPLLRGNPAMLRRLLAQMPEGGRTVPGLAAAREPEQARRCIERFQADVAALQPRQKRVMMEVTAKGRELLGSIDAAQARKAQ